MRRALGANMGMLLKEEGDGDGGGGGAPDDKSGKFTDAQMEQIGEVASRVANSAFTAQFKRLNLDQKIAEAVGGLDIDGKLDKLAQDLKTERALGPSDPPGNKTDPTIIKLQEQIEALKKTNETESAARKAAEQKSRDEFARSTLRGALAEHVTPGAVDTVTRLLFDAEKRVSFDEEGNPYFTVRKSPGAGIPEEDMQFPISDGVSQWLKTDEAKLFMPAPTPQAGARTPSPRSIARGADGMPRYEAPATTDAERARRATEKEAALRKQYGIT